MVRPLYIFDLDGTLALIDHRRPVLLDKNDPERWDRFYSMCFGDVPNKPVIETMERLWQSGAEIWIFSGRRSEVRNQTMTWLNKYTNIMSWGTDMSLTLTMRPENDHRPDNELKKAWLDGMLLDDRERLVAVFDDRDRIVKMWRDNGITCFQVAPGEF